MSIVEAGVIAQVLETIVLEDDLMLRAVTLDDVEGMYKLLDANREYLAEFVDFARTYTYEKAVDDFEKTDEDRAAGTMMYYGIFDSEQMAGSITLSLLESKKAVIGCWLAESAQGRGIANRASHALIAYAFDKRGVDSVLMDIKPENIASQKAAERLGAVRNGAFVQKGASAFEVWEVRKGQV